MLRLLDTSTASVETPHLQEKHEKEELSEILAELDLITHQCHDLEAKAKLIVALSDLEQHLITHFSIVPNFAFLSKS